MKKLILALATVAFIGIGGSAVSAQPSDPDPLPGQTPPPECAEPGPPTIDIDGNGTLDVSQECVQFYFQEAQIPPVVAPATTVPVTVPPAQLPRTGSGVSPILGVGALLLVGGGIVVVATRRRSTSTSPST